MVAEVASRFEDLRAFMNGMAQLGFKSVNKVGLQGSLEHTVWSAMPREATV